MSADQVQIGWLAGIIDGEGCLHAWKASKSGIVAALSISSTDRRLMDKVLAILLHFGIQKTAGYFVRKTPNCKPVWYLQLARRNQLKQLLPALIPYLTAKQDQARLVLELASDTPFTRWNASIRPEVVARRTEILANLRKLNFRGTPSETSVNAEGREETTTAAEMQGIVQPIA